MNFGPEPDPKSPARLATLPPPYSQFNNGGFRSCLVQMRLPYFDLAVLIKLVGDAELECYLNQTVFTASRRLFVSGQKPSEIQYKRFDSGDHFYAGTNSENSLKA